MADIKKCDRCGDAYDPYHMNINWDQEWWRYSVHKDCHPYSEIKLDLCPRCRKELVNWIKNKE